MSSLKRTKLFSSLTDQLDLVTYTKRCIRREQKQYKLATSRYANKQKLKLNRETSAQLNECLNQFQIALSIDESSIKAIEQEKGFSIDRTQVSDDLFDRWPLAAVTPENYLKVIVCLDNSAAELVVGGQQRSRLSDDDLISVDDILAGELDNSGARQQVKIWRALVLNVNQEGRATATNEAGPIRVKLIGAQDKQKFSLLQTIVDSYKSDDSAAQVEPKLRLILVPDFGLLVKRRVLIERALAKFVRLQSCSLEIHKCLLGAYNDCRNQTQRGYHNDFVDAAANATSGSITPSSVSSGVAHKIQPTTGPIKPVPLDSMPTPVRDRLIDLDGMVELRDLQRQAVRRSMRQRISLIEGGAGTGKTVVAANLACQLSRLRRRKVLVCSPVQTTVDKLARMIDTYGGDLLVVQLPHERADLIEPNRLMPHLTKLDQRARAESRHTDSDEGDAVFVRNACLLDNYVDHAIYQRAINKFRAFYGEKNPQNQTGGDYLMWKRQRAELEKLASRSLEKCSDWLRHRMERKMVKEADIVCCTLEQAGGWLLKGVHFDALIIDDAQVASELSCLIALTVPGLKQVTLLSDVRRDIRLARSRSNANGRNSYPDQRSKSLDRLANKAARKGQLQRKRSFSTGKGRDEYFTCEMHQANDTGNLFERLLSIGLSSVGLRYQYRLHETLAKFTNRHFYLDRLRNDPDVNRQLEDLRAKKLTGGGDYEQDIVNEKSLANEVAEFNQRFNWLPNSKYLSALFDCKKDYSSGTCVDSIIKSLGQCLLDILDNLLTKESVSGADITILANSNRLIRLLNLRHGAVLSSRRVNITTVDKYIGQEQDFVILICVPEKALIEGGSSSGPNSRTTSKLDLNLGVDCDYLESDSALNVSLTRGRFGLFIVTCLKSMLIAESSTSVEEQNERAMDKTEDNNNNNNSSTNNINNTDTSNNNGKPKRLKFDQSICKSWRRLVSYYNEIELIAQKEEMTISL